MECLNTSVTNPLMRMSDKVNDDQLALRILAVSGRRYMTYTAVSAVFFFVLFGFASILDTLPKYASSLGLLATALVMLGMIFTGAFLAFGTLHTFSKKLYLLNHPNTASPKK